MGVEHALEIDPKRISSRRAKRPILLWLAIVFTIAGVGTLFFADRTQPDIFTVSRAMRVTRALDEQGLLEPVLAYVAAEMNQPRRPSFDSFFPKPSAQPIPPQITPKDNKASGTGAGKSSASSQVTISPQAKSPSTGPTPVGPVAPAPNAFPQITPVDLRIVLDVLEQEYASIVEETNRHVVLTGIGTALLVLGLVFFVGHLLSHFDGREPVFSASPVTAIPDRINIVADTLLTRSQQLRMEAKQFITLIFILALGGITLFYFANEFSYEQRASENGLFDAVENLLERHQDTQQQIANLYSDATMDATDGADGAVNTAILQQAAVTAGHLVELAKSNASSRELEMAINRNVLISSITARAGIILIIGYLIRILLSSYKYNLRLATFLSSRAYALSMLDPEQCPKTLADFTAVLGPEALDFDQAAETQLLESAIKTAKNVAS